MDLTSDGMGRIILWGRGGDGDETLQRQRWVQFMCECSSPICAKGNLWCLCYDLLGLVLSANNLTVLFSFFVISGKECVREGRRSYGNGAGGSCREDERFRNKQVGPRSERGRHGVRAEHSVDVAQRLHSGVLTRPQVDELLLLSAQASSVW